MPVHETVAAAANTFNGATLLNCSLDRRIALGVKQGGAEDNDAWVILSISAGLATVAEFRVCGALADADSALGVDIVVLASASVWGEIGAGGVAAAIAAADAHRIVVSGKLPYFIRHVRSTVDLMVAFGQEINRHS